MSKDPIVDAVRTIRAAIAKEHGNDLEKINSGLQAKRGRGRHAADSARDRERAATGAWR